MTKKHLTSTGQTFTSESIRDYGFVSVGTDRDGNRIAYAWHVKAPKTPAFSYLANLAVEPINGGRR